MKGDFTRSTFNRQKHYSGVRMQQGRVQLDADWNEQVDIEQYRDQTTTGDVIGATGVPVLPDGTSSGFMIQLPGANPTEPTMKIRQGRIYVDGILCENEEDILYTAQPDYPNATAATSGLNVIYLDVWERHMTALEDPEIQEVALGGPDTATRTKTVWQVKYLPVSTTPGTSCKTDYPEWDALVAPSTGKLNVHTAPPAGGTSGEPCIVPPAAGYRGLENQLYRVEIHKVVGTDLYYKWSRDNGSFLFAVEQVNAGSSTIKVKSLGRDESSGLRVNDWIEIRDRAQILAGTPGVLAKIAQIDTVDRILTLTLESGGSLGGYNAATGQVTVRRWDFTGSAPPKVTIASNAATAWLPIELGVEVQFVPESSTLSAAYKGGNYWMFAARTATQDVEWPKDGSDPVAQVAQGIKHHYCRLALASYASGAWNRTSLKDCRPTFLSLADIPTLGFHFVGGDGQEGLRGAALPRPLEVSVTERGRRVAGARVRFTVKLGNGRVKTTRVVDGVSTEFVGTEVIAETGPDGIASCEFTLDNVTASQQVEALILDEFDLPLSLNPIHFNAAFNSSGTDFTYVSGDGQEGDAGAVLPRPIQVGVNDQGQVQAGAHVRFRIVGGTGTLSTKKLVSGTLTTVTGADIIAVTGSDGVASCSWTLDATTRDQQVEARLLDESDQLRNITPIYFNATLNTDLDFLYVGGDGQEALPGATLPAPLEVGVLDVDRRVQGKKVKFKVIGGTGTLKAPGVTPASAITVETGADGIAFCEWTLDATNPGQRVEANLVDADGNVLNFTPVHFNATISHAKGVAYLPPTGCEKFTGATTVKEALDKLCACDCAPDCQPVIRVTGIYLGTTGSDLGAPIHPYTTLTPDTLKNGIRITTDTQIDSESVKPCTVYLETLLPYPVAAQERADLSMANYNPSVPISQQIIGYQPAVMPAAPSVDLTDNTVITWMPNETALTMLNTLLTGYGRTESFPIKFHLKGPSIWAEGDTGKVLAGQTKYTGNTPQFPSGEDCEHGSDFIFCFNIVKNPPVETPCEKITSVVLDQPVITGQDLAGTLYLDKKTQPATSRTYKVTSDSNSVIPSNQLVTVAGDSDKVVFALETTSDAVMTRTPVKLTFTTNNASDPCQTTFTTVVNVDPVPCDGIVSITTTDTVIGEQIHGTITYAKSSASGHTLSYIADNDRIPAGQTLTVGSTTTGTATFTLETDATPTTPVTTPVSVMVRVTDPCGQEHEVPVTIKPVPCVKIKKITFDPCQGGSPAHVMVDFYEPVKAPRTLAFISKNEDVVESNSVSVAIGDTQAQLYLATNEVSEDTTVTLVLNDCDEVIHQDIVIRKKPCEELAEFYFNPNPIGGSPITGNLRLATTAAETRRIDFMIDSDAVIDLDQYKDITVANGTSLVPFSLTSKTVETPTDVVVTVVHCGKTYIRFVRVYPVPCEPPIELHFAKNPIIGGTQQTGYVQLQAPSYSSDKPITIKCSDPTYFPDLTVPVAADDQQVEIAFTMPTVTEQREYAFKAVRPCGETEWVPVSVQPPSTDRPRLRGVEVSSPVAPEYVYPFTTPTEYPRVNLSKFGQAAGSAYTVQVVATFCGLMPDASTINTQTVQVYYLGETPHSQGQLLTGVDVQFDLAQKKIWCNIPSALINTHSYYRVVLKGTGSAPVLAASGAALAGAFTRPFNTANCSGDEIASSFVAEFYTIWDPVQP